ncbi:MAG: helicase [Erysipelotrichaceae bacterium]|nr:helicase [Erysipelotrichaceae bacterium]
MIEESELEKHLGNSRILEKARDLYYSGSVGRLSIGTVSGDYKGISAFVNDSVRNQVSILLDEDGESVIDYSCSCPYCRQSGRMCEHIAAAVLKYSYEPVSRLSASDDFDAASFHVQRKTSQEMAKMLKEYEAINVLPASFGVRLVPLLQETGDGEVDLHLWIGRQSGRMLRVHSMTELVHAADEGTLLTYGKNLSFVPEADAFAPDAENIFGFLSSVQHIMDRASAGSYSEQSGVIGDTLHLSGALIDQFFACAGPENLYIADADVYPDEQYRVLPVSGSCDLQIRMEERSDEGYVISCLPFICLEGDRKLYLVLKPQAGFRMRQLYTADSTRKRQLLPFLRAMRSSGGEGQYIRRDDLPSFTRNAWKSISEAFPVDSGSFDAERYLPPRPKFTVQLDLPVQERISCEASVRYGEAEYSLFSEDDPDLVRNVIDENKFRTMLRNTFPGIDMENQNIYLEGDEAIYSFLKEGIHQLSAYAQVMISDRLKGIAVRSAPSMHFGVSFSHDLLQLDMAAESMSQSEIAEILSRYDRKRKYYRLKSGDFVELDENFDSIYSAVQDLQLTGKELRSGHAEMPLYRAMYLDSLRESESMSIARDQLFSDLLSRIRNVEKKEYTVPSHLEPVIRDYQRKGFSWLCSLRDLGFGALLADEMGLGKTLQVIAMLGEWKNRKRTLIVCPSSLVYNWANEIRKFAPGMKYEIISGPANIRHELIRRTSENDVLITSYTLLQKDLNVYNEMTFDCQIIDEAQYIKNPATNNARSVKSVHSGFRVALTGTPIENRLSELWSIFDYLMPGLLNSYQSFRLNYELPIMADQDEDAFARLRKIASPFILRRMKTDVLQDLPPKMEEVIYAPLEEEQRDIYQASVMNLRNHLSNQSDQEFRENRIEILAELTRLRQICCTPQLLYNHYRGNSAKEDTCIELLKSAVESGHKVLLFSQFTTMLDVLIRRIRKEGISFHLLTGSTPQAERMHMVESFDTDDVPLFLISLKAGGTGLNLTAADIVIHYDPWWNTAVENQASDRAHRIGQKNVVTVYRLILQDTIEERIIELQNTKKELAGKILSDERMSSASLSRSELLELL